jgi:adenylate kinase
MIVAISGTPGTGKTRVSGLIARRLNAELISIKKLLDTGKLPYTWDEKRKTRVIDPKDLKKVVKIITKHGGDYVIEGHLSHLVKSDVVIVLRCNPVELKKRLKKRKWSKNKIKENIMAEILDEVTIEALQNNKSVFEIDTSNRDERKTANLIMKILKKTSGYRKYIPGYIDWTEKYFKYFLERC